MAIPFDKSSRLPGTRTPISDSALVRTRWPSWPLMPGSEPFSLSRKSRSSVPSAEAANTTPRQVKRRRPPGSNVADHFQGQMGLAVCRSAAHRGADSGGVHRVAKIHVEREVEPGGAGGRDADGLIHHGAQAALVDVAHGER